jgi:hypothetical protein
MPGSNANCQGSPWDTRDDFCREGDLLIWEIKGTKTDYRARVIPLRSALIAEGFEA